MPIWLCSWKKQRPCRIIPRALCWLGEKFREDEPDRSLELRRVPGYPTFCGGRWGIAHTRSRYTVWFAVQGVWWWECFQTSHTRERCWLNRITRLLFSTFICRSWCSIRKDGVIQSEHCLVKLCCWKTIEDLGLVAHEILHALTYWHINL